MKKLKSLVARVALVAGLLTQTSGGNWLKVEAAVSTGRPALISPLQSPLASPDAGPATGQTAPDAGGGAPIRLQVDFESRVVRNNQSLHGALRAEWQGGHGEAAPATAFTATLDFPVGLDYMTGSSAGQYDAAQRRLTWQNVQLDAANQLVLPFQATAAVLDTPARLAVIADAQGAETVRFFSRPAQLNVSRTTPGQVVSARSGGQFQTASGRVRLDFSRDAILGESVVITGEEYAPMPPSALMPGISPADWKGLAQTAYQDSFGADPQQSLDNDIARLSLADPLLKVDFYPSMVFSRPVTATFDLGGQIADELAASGLAPMLQSVSETPFTSTYQVSPTLSVIVTNTRRTFEEVPSWYDPDTGRLTAFIGHFSTYEVTVDSQLPKPWKMVANLGEMNIFRGAYNYSYPLEVPPMQDGLAPKLALSYSSAKADYDGSLETLGHGWSLDLPRVTRKLQQTAYVSTNYYPIEQGPAYEGNCPHPVNDGWCWYVVGSYDTISGYQLQYEDKFSLSFGGQDMYLVQKSSSVSEFVTLNYTPLRIYRCSNTINCGGAVVSNTNASGEYWQVWTPDGVRYVFGADQQSEARLNQTTPTNATVTQAWYLKAVFAPYRDDPAPSVNRASAQYFYQQKTDAGGAYQTNLTEVDYGNRCAPMARSSGHNTR
ncbi:MAG: hypothetical protein M1140_11905 [Chloroflexi bacterium]|nr:hypothetical protein [Chloroflexota bacterium]